MRRRQLPFPVRPRRISPIDRIENADQEVRAALLRSMRAVGERRRRVSHLQVAAGIAAAALMLTSLAGVPLLASVALLILGMVMLVSAGRRILASPPPAAEHVMRAHLRTRWFDRALAGRLRGSPPDVAARYRFVRDHVQPAIAPVRSLITPQLTGLWLLTAALAALTGAATFALADLADYQTARAEAMQDPADPKPWVQATGAADAGLAARSASEAVMRAGVALIGSSCALALAASIAGPAIIRRRVLRSACPACGYDLSATGDALPPQLGARGCGPALCPECACPWPRIPMATDEEILAAGATAQHP